MAEKTKIDVLQVLINGGLDEDIAKKAKSIIEKDIIPKNYVPSDQYNDKVLELANATNEAKKANDDLIAANTYEQKYDNEVIAHKATVDGYAAEKDAADIDSKMSEALKAAGFNEKSLGDLMNDKRLDRSIVKRGKDGNLSNSDEVVTAVKSIGNWGSHFGTVQTVGAGVATPPKGDGGFSEIKSLSATTQALNAHRITK